MFADECQTVAAIGGNEAAGENWPTHAQNCHTETGRLRQ